jgi:hypothetical protein
VEIQPEFQPFNANVGSADPGILEINAFVARLGSVSEVRVF